jgi:hypothetical protein
MSNGIGRWCAGCQFSLDNGARVCDGFVGDTQLLRDGSEILTLAKQPHDIDFTGRRLSERVIGEVSRLGYIEGDLGLDVLISIRHALHSS